MYLAKFHHVLFFWLVDILILFVSTMHQAPYRDDKEKLTHVHFNINIMPPPPVPTPS